MKILYLSNSVGNLYSGPSYSIPAQIEAQSKYDEVFWYNSVISKQTKWKELPYYFDISEIKTKKLNDIIKFTGKPDLIIIEQFYNHIRDHYLYDIFFSSIPYIIVPRGELTKKAQQRKKIKKYFVNLAIAKFIINKAVSIHFLTEKERDESGSDWNQHSIVIPNGMTIPTESRTYFTKDVLQFISIGRIEPYQKGLDILIDALYSMRDELLRQNCRFDLYGADVDGKAIGLKKRIKELGLEKFVAIHGPVYNEKKINILQSADIYIMPSRFEGHPMALIEAMAYGLPCIVSEGSNMRQEVDHWEAGWSFGTSVDELKCAIKKSIHNRTLINFFGKNAKELAKEFDWNRIAKLSHNEYLELIQKER